MTICQAMNISLRTGRKLQWIRKAEQFDVAEANRISGANTPVESLS